MNALELTTRLRELTGYEEEWLERINGKHNVPATCHFLLACCLGRAYEPEPDALAAVRQLSLAERDWLLLELRRRSLGERIRSAVQCPQCGGHSELEFASQDLPIAPTVALTPGEFQLPSGRRAVLRPLTAEDHEHFAAAAGLDHSGQMALALTRALLSLDDAAPSEVWSALDAVDQTALEAALRASIPEVVQLALRCEHCEQALSAPFDVCAFFLPS